MLLIGPHALRATGIGPWGPGPVMGVWSPATGAVQPIDLSALTFSKPWLRELSPEAKKQPLSLVASP